MSRGFTLIEVVVALLLLEVAVLAAAGSLSVASHTLSEAEWLERAVMEAEGVLDSIEGVAIAGDGARAFADGSLEWAVDPSGGVLLHVLTRDSTVRLEVASALNIR